MIKVNRKQAEQFLKSATSAVKLPEHTSVPLSEVNFAASFSWAKFRTTTDGTLYVYTSRNGFEVR